MMAYLKHAAGLVGIIASFSICPIWVRFSFGSIWTNMFQLGFSTTTTNRYGKSASPSNTGKPQVWASCKDVDLAHKLKREVPCKAFVGVWANVG